MELRVLYLTGCAGMGATGGIAVVSGNLIILALALVAAFACGRYFRLIVDES